MVWSLVGFSARGAGIAKITEKMAQLVAASTYPGRSEEMRFHVEGFALPR
jgi:hypothetical protein